MQSTNSEPDSTKITNMDRHFEKACPATRSAAWVQMTPASGFS